MTYLRMLLAIAIAFLGLNTHLQAQSPFKYSYVPKTLYPQQIFPVTLICISECTKEDPHFSFDPQSPLQPLFQKPLIIRNGADNFYTFYFQVNANHIRIPRLSIDKSKEHFELPSQAIRVVSLDAPEGFCGVISADMKIQNSQVSNYDESHHLVTLSIRAYEANIESFNLPWSVEYGVEHIQRENAKVEAEVYVVLPVEQKELSFSYFNTIKREFVTLSLPIELRDDSVTTQSDLNPKEDSFTLLKKYTLIFFTLFFFVMLLAKKDLFYLLFALLSLITLLTFYIPHKKVCIQQGASLYILPTPTSTITTKIEEKQERMVLGKRGEYVKIEYKKGLIGWIRNEDLCKD